MEGGLNDVLRDIIADNFHSDMRIRPGPLFEECGVEIWQRGVGRRAATMMSSLIGPMTVSGSDRPSTDNPIGRQFVP